MNEDVTGQQAYQTKLAALSREFSDRLPDRLAEINAAVAAFSDAGDAGARTQSLNAIAGLAHKLIGSSGTYGLLYVSKAAAALEAACSSMGEENDDGSADDPADDKRVISEIVDLLGSAINAGISESSLDAVGLANLTPGLSESGSSHVLIVDDDDAVVKFIEAYLTAQGIAFQSLPDVTNLRASLEEAQPALLVMDIMFPGDEDAGVKVVQEFRQEGILSCPVVFMSERDDFDARLGAVRVGGNGYVVKPVDDRLFGAIDRLLVQQKQQLNPYRILIIDDDEPTANYYAAVLEEFGLSVVVETRPENVLKVIEENHSELIVMDVNMPGCNGYELAAIIRQVRGLLQVPIVFLTAEQEMGRRAQALRSGGDDFFSKPVRPDIFVQSILARAERSRRLTHLIDRQREDELRFRSIITNTAEGIITIDGAGIMETVNPSAERIFGYDQAELVGRNVSMLIPEDERHHHDAYVENSDLFEAKIINRARDLYGLRKNGETFPMELNVSPMADAKGQMFIGILRDITDRKAAELALSRREMESRLLNKAGNLAMTAETFAGALELFLAMICTEISWPLGHAYIQDPHDTGRVMSSLCWYAEVDDEFTDFRTLTEETLFKSGEGLPGRVLETLQAQWVSDVQTDTNIPRNRDVSSHNIHAAFSFPIMVDGACVAVLEFFHREAQAEPPGLISTMAAVGQQIGVVIERKRAEAALAESERRFRDYASTIADRFWETDEHHRYTYFSTEKGTLIATTEELIGQTHWEVGDRKPITGNWDALKERLHAKLPFRGVRYQWMGVGYPLYVELAGIPTFDSDGIFLGYRGTVTDVTESVLAVSREKELVDRFQQLFENANDAIFIIDPVDGRFIDVNTRAAEYLGYSRDELCLLSVNDINPESKRIGYNKFVTQAVDAIDKNQILESEHLHKDGHLIPVEISTRNIQYGGKEVVQSFVRNITERKQVEERLQDSEQAMRDAKDVADQANKAKSDFLSSMSHELRTPLNAILGFSQLLEFNPEEPLTESQQEFVDHIMKGGNHLLELINEVLDLARIESGNLSLFMEFVETAEVIDECLLLVGPMAKKEGLEVFDQIERADLAMVYADRTRLKQALLNLLSNAIKYNRPEGTVTLETKQLENSQLRICVSDTGAGIPELKQTELFKPFSRLGAETTEIEGTGIGLTIMSELINRMGGTVGFKSTVDVGSSFWVDLNTSIPESDTETQMFSDEDVSPGGPSDASDAANKPGSGNDIGESPAGISGTILYVEDNPANVSLIKSLITRYSDLEFHHSPEAESGLRKARELKPDMIIMDINLPGMNGFEALEHLRDMDETRDIPVLALSANAMPDSIENGRKAGFVDYLTKPVDIDELMTIVNDVMNKAKP